MSEVVRYGKTPGEKTAEENLECRQIVKEISNYGITQRQQKLLIYLLALELEDIDLMKTVTSTIKDLVGDELFLMGKDEEVSDGKIDS